MNKLIGVLVTLGLLGWAFGDASDGETPPPGETRAESGRTAVEKPAPRKQTGPAPGSRQPGTTSPGRSGHAVPLTPRPSNKPSREPVARMYVVTRVVDGDTVELGNGETVRLVGIDTPEEGECGYDQATRRLEGLVLGRRVTLGESDEDRDGYGRLLRYVDRGRLDAGLRLLRAGLAIARYDSRDGYGRHPREDRYVRADRGARNLICPTPVAPVPLVASPQQACAPGYDPCVPPYGPDLDCGDLDGPIAVSGSDPHGLDADGDGVACES